jgi:hypothetical protein
MSNLAKLLLWGGSTKLRAYEAQCLAFLAKTASIDPSDVLRRQCKMFTMVQRFSNDKLVVFHFDQARRAELPLFRNLTPELSLGRLAITPNGSSDRIACNVVVHRGRISSLEFSYPPKRVLESGLSLAEGTLDVRLLDQDASSPSAPTANGTGEVIDLIKSHLPITNIIPSRGDAEVSILVERLGIYPDETYQALIGEACEFETTTWRFCGRCPRHLVLPDRDYWIVAERKDGRQALCFEGDDRSGRVVLYDEINNEVIRSESNFVAVLLEVFGDP